MVASLLGPSRTLVLGARSVWVEEVQELRQQDDTFFVPAPGALDVTTYLSALDDNRRAIFGRPDLRHCSAMDGTTSIG